MNLDNRTIFMRPRRSWEAVDLGILMARRWWWSLMMLWLCLTLPVFVITSFLPSSWLPYQMLLLWWLKPIFERPLLYSLSQNVFGEYPSLRESLRKFPKLASQQVVLSLTWRRFSPSRSLDSPVLQLEGLAGERRMSRLSVLHKDGVAPATGLTVFGVHIESFIALSLIVLAFAFVPEEFELSPWGVLMSDSYWLKLALNAAAYVGMSLVAPFYVASGFALYLNRRIHLEAWDIEIAFKRIANMREQKTAQTPDGSNSSSNILASLLLVVILFSIFPSTSIANQTEQTLSAENAELVFDEINEIKKQDTFNVRASQRRIKHGADEPDSSSSESWDLSWLKLPEGSAYWLSTTGEYVLWFAVIALVFFVVFRYRYWIKHYVLNNEASPSDSVELPPKTLFGLQVTQRSLPDNVSDAAKELWLADEKRKALALIYRASLTALIGFGVQLRSGDTEGICLKKTADNRSIIPAGQDKFSYFEKLTEVWKMYAYGHVEPSRELALGLCETWNDVWLTKTDYEV